jgi:protein phosphatase
VSKTHRSRRESQKRRHRNGHEDARPTQLRQPGIKCRGGEYLRIIYGPEYADPSQIERLRSRNLGRKRGLALREFSLGIEALERFVRREPLYRVHECAFAVLALESEPVDPRLR